MPPVWNSLLLVEVSTFYSTEPNIYNLLKVDYQTNDILINWFGDQNKVKVIEKIFHLLVEISPVHHILSKL